MSAYGPPIVQGAISTIIATLPLFYIRSYILNTFAKMVLLVVGLGALHGLILLPSFMALGTIHILRKQKCYTIFATPAIERIG